jgi:hypothetical protein
VGLRGLYYRLYVSYLICVVGSRSLDVLDERGHDARGIANGQLKTIRRRSLAVSWTVVGQPSQRQTDEDVKTRSDEEAPVLLLDSVCVELLPEVPTQSNVLQKTQAISK